MSAVEALLEKADRSLKSAKLLLKAGDADGATNRLYDALRAAASAALLQHRIKIPKTHGALIAAFGQHIVAPA